MANIAATDLLTPVGTLVEVIAAMEVLLETIDTSKTLYLVDIKETQGGGYVGMILHQA